MRVSKYFNLGRSQSTLDFLDINLDGDIRVFVDPNALRAIGTEWGHECVALLENYFQTVLDTIKNGDNTKAQSLLSSLSERNEFHLGFSKGKSRGHALGPASAKRIWDSLVKSKAIKTGLLQDLEDTVLFVEGVGPDMLSDAICNIIRGPLIKYTQEACEYYGIPLTNGVNSGPLWNAVAERWESSLVRLPIAKNEVVILVPKIIVRVRQSYEASSYYTNYLMPMMQEYEKSINSALVYVVKTGPNKGAKKVNKKDLATKYGASKIDSTKLTGNFPAAFTKYKNDRRNNPSMPLDHMAFSELESITPPNFAKLVGDVLALSCGNSDASKYESAIEKLLSALFYPALSFPRKQHEIHDGRKRIDITYGNSASDGFFKWLANHYCAPHVFVECKNYGKEVGNPELDQLAGRFSPSRGNFGLMIVRSLKNRPLIETRCKDTAKDSRGYIIVIDDADLSKLVSQRGSILNGFNDNLLYRRFQALIN